MICGTRLCAGYILYPVTDAILPFSVHRIFLLLSVFPPLHPFRQMSSVSSAAFLLWAILAVIVRRNRSKHLRKPADSPSCSPPLLRPQFLVFLTQHLWNYDRFNCLRWNSGRQPGAFKRVMTVSSLTVAMNTAQLRWD